MMLYRRTLRAVLHAFFGVCTGFILDASAAFAQGFSVSPVRVEANVPSGRNIDIPITLANRDTLQTFRMTVQHVELQQNRSGSWAFSEVLDPSLSNGHRSNRSWFADPSQAILVGPDQSEELILTATVPRAERGTSLSALLITSEAQGEAGDAVRLRFQFLVPIILTVSGRSARQNISLDDLELVLRAQPGSQGGFRAETEMIVANTGETYSRVQGTVRIERKNGDNWRLVTIAEVTEHGSIPGSTLALAGDLGRSLPSGTYRLTGNLSVDGRFLPRFTREVEFEGDPTLDTLAYDAALLIEPGRVDVTDLQPGSSRSQAIKLTNPSDATIVATLSFEVPPGLENVAIGELVGRDLSADPFLTAQPMTVTLRPNRSRNVRMVVRLPDDLADHPQFFADFVTTAVYEDGQAAGESRAPVFLERSDLRATPNVIIETMNFAAVDTPGEHVVRARVVNAGNGHTTLQASAQLINTETSRVQDIPLSGGEDLMLPLAVWDYAGPFDIASLSPGDYILRVAFADAVGGRATEDIPITLVEGDDGTVEIAESSD